MKKITSILLSVTLIASLFCIPAMAQEETGYVDMVPISAPVSTGPAVLFNGDYLTFGDAHPQIVNDRTYLPLRAIFNAFGISDDNITWNEATGLITANAETVIISMIVGDTTVQLTYPGANIFTFEMDVVPFIDVELGRTYVPVRFVALALGYNVGWDAVAGTVIIDDVAGIIAANGETYELMDKISDYSSSFENTRFAGTAAFDLEMSMLGETVGLGVSMTMLQEYLAVEYGVTVDLSQIDPTLSVMNMEIRGDLETGVLYISAPELLSELGIDGDVWLKLDLATLIGDIGMDYSELIALSIASAESMTTEDFIAIMLYSLPLEDVSYTTSDMLAELNAIIGDSAFTKTGNTYTNKTIIDGIAVEISVTTSGDKVTGYTFTAKGEVDGMSIDMSMSMVNNKMSVNMDINAEIDGLTMEMTLTVDGTYSNSNSAPKTEPPAGATVVDFATLLGF